MAAYLTWPFFPPHMIAQHKTGCTCNDYNLSPNHLELLINDILREHSPGGRGSRAGALYLGKVIGSPASTFDPTTWPRYNPDFSSLAFASQAVEGRDVTFTRTEYSSRRPTSRLTLVLRVVVVVVSDRGNRWHGTTTLRVPTKKSLVHLLILKSRCSSIFILSIVHLLNKKSHLLKRWNVLFCGRHFFRIKVLQMASLNLSFVIIGEQLSCFSAQNIFLCVRSTWRPAGDVWDGRWLRGFGVLGGMAENRIRRS